jgi:molybdopterin-guanine dinucleotide biosynthesis protein
MAPFRAKAADMVASAKTLAASVAPKGCDTPKLKEAAAALPVHTQAAADLIGKKADDAALKAALKDLHDKFDVLEAGCVMPKKPGIQ